MKMRVFTVSVFALILSACTSETQSGSSTAPAVAARASDEGKTLINPVPANPASIDSGKKLFEKLCVGCHGEKGDGASAVAAAMPQGETKPSNLIDDQWDHGSTDGDIFVVIRDGSGGSAPMKGLNGRPGVGPTEMWNLVNYIRSLKATPGAN